MTARFDNHDSRLRYVHLGMKLPADAPIPDYPLPDGYRFAFYAPGDRYGWQMLRTLTNHPALTGFEPLPEEALLSN